LASPNDDLDQNFTPTKDFAPLNAEFLFTLDPCATKESAKTPRYFTKTQDGLKQSWRGERVWLNPPYSDITAWLRKATEELKTGCPLVVALLPAWTDRRWWHAYIEKARTKRYDGCEVRFLKGRIKFGCPGDPEGKKRVVNGKRRSTGKFPSVIVIWRRPGYEVLDPRQQQLFEDDRKWFEASMRKLGVKTWHRKK